MTTVGTSAFSIDTSDLKQFAQEIGPEATRIINVELDTAGKRAGKHARDRANERIRHKSRKLANSAKVTTQSSGSRSSGTTLGGSVVVTTVAWKALNRGFDYAGAVNFGRGPVVAKRAKALRFEVNGEIIFRKSVGPAPAQHFAEKGLQAAEPQIMAEHRAAVGRAVRRIGAR